MNMEAAVHAGAVALALLSAVVALVLRRRLAAGGLLALTCVMAAVWAAHVAWVLQVGLLLGAQVLWMPAIGATISAFYVVVHRTARPGWRPSRRLAAVLVVEPVFVLVCRVALSDTPLLALPGRPVVPLVLVFGLHTVYCFALLVLAVPVLARRRQDRSPAVRAQVTVVQWGAVAALVAEALRLQLTDVVAVVTLTLFTVAGALGRRGGVGTPPTSEELLDDLGALVLVFDTDQRLVEWNRPAEVLCTLRGLDEPLGAHAEAVLGVGLPVPDGTVVVVELGSASATFTGYCHRRYDETDAPGPGNGWVVLLRRGRSSATGQSDAAPAQPRLTVVAEPGAVRRPRPPR
ncbi:histidine kinase N-terminal 7TM domain-containing protein [Nocardioides sp. CPCC 205120]|uniref:histidine kinase N-terminal 7TM domain-containing protein n=1 Tax=Nocardioides sp. CPCC 205120 TaxID=3406462 RepID=UPI003B504087